MTRSAPPMRQGILLEICAQSVDCAVAAQRGEAHRIELCADLASEGITPSAGTMAVARKLLRIPIHVLIRPRPGGFVYSAAEFEMMRRDIELAKELSMDGIVAGVLDNRSRVDTKRMREIVRLAHPLPVTFHRAFDESRDIESALEAVVDIGAKRILTSGQRKSAVEGISRLARLVELARDRIIIMPGGGIRAANVVRIARQTKVSEVHTSLGAASDHRDGMACGSARSVYERSVHRVARLLSALSREIPRTDVAWLD